MPPLKPHFNGDRKRATTPGPGAYDTHLMDITVVKGSRSRASAFGGKLASAKRTDVSPSPTPGPGAYGAKSGFDDALDKKTRHWFGKSSRDGPRSPTTVPGPGAYRPEDALKNAPLSHLETPPTISFGGNLANVKRESPKKSTDVPGPGAYAVEKANISSLSRHPSVPGGDIPKSDRFRAPNKDAPQPSLVMLSSSFDSQAVSSLRAPPKMKFTGKSELDVTITKEGVATMRPKSSVSVPGPGQYVIDSTINPNKSASKGRTSFGLSDRPSLSQAIQTPGPAAYDPTATVTAPVSHRRSTPNIKFSKSTRDPDEKKVLSHRAGGGMTGSELLSKSIGTNQQPIDHRGTPGPGEYILSQSLGKQVLSNRSSSPSIVLGSSRRESYARQHEGFGEGGGDANAAKKGKDTPGPGAYVVPSTIGTNPPVSHETRASQFKFGSSTRDDPMLRHRLESLSGLGPGSYASNIPAIGKMPVSTKKTASAFSFSHADRSVDDGNASKLPGPGQYDGTSGMGTQTVSNKSTAPAPRFGSSTRDNWAIVSAPDKLASTVKQSKGTFSPGPGQYTPIKTLGKTITSVHSSSPAFVFGTSERDS